MNIFKIFLFTITLFTLSYSKSYYQELYELTDEQKQVFVTSVKAGEKYDLSLTLAAIAWKESNFGLKKVNKKDGRYGSYGVYQILLDNYLRRKKLNHDKTTIKQHKLKLIKDNEYNAKMAVTELVYWGKRYKNNYRKMIASYNAGNAGVNSPRGKKYYKDIAYRVRTIQKFIRNY